MSVKRYEVGAVPQGNPANEDYFISIRRDKRDITQWDLPLPDAHTIVDELNALQVDVERLRKAIEDADDKLKLLAEWAVVCEVESAQVNQVRDILLNAAKEGKPSV